jgi:hypothetical protein
MLDLARGAREHFWFAVTLLLTIVLSVAGRQVVG